MKRNIVIFILLLNVMASYSQRKLTPDTLRGMYIADSIVESKHIINKRNYFRKNFKKLRKEIGSSDSVVVHNYDIIEFIVLLDDMSDYGFIKNPYIITISLQQYHSIRKWYKKVSRYITLPMLKNFIKGNYMLLCSDYEKEKMDRLLCQYRENLMFHYKNPKILKKSR